MAGTFHDINNLSGAPQPIFGAFRFWSSPVASSAESPSQAGAQ
ncbi:MAG TPA: hypothetical protein VGC76_01520 [Pyrinomonadaceae bacterium]